VLEQAAFSELQLDAPVKMDKLLQMMGKVEGYRVEQPVLVKTTAGAEGWLLKAPVAGFKPMSCYKRPAAAAVPLAIAIVSIVRVDQTYKFIIQLKIKQNVAHVIMMAKLSDKTIRALVVITKVSSQRCKVKWASRKCHGTPRLDSLICSLREIP